MQCFSILISISIPKQTHPHIFILLSACNFTVISQGGCVYTLSTIPCSIKMANGQGIQSSSRDLVG